MSIEQAQAFMEKVKNDEGLAKRLNEAEDSESRLSIAKEMGYEFSPEEARHAKDQLSPDELERVAEGGEVTFVCPRVNFLVVRGYT